MLGAPEEDTVSEDDNVGAGLDAGAGPVAGPAAAEEHPGTVHMDASGRLLF